jgi:FAD/FMN-containing dehydrogenase/Fe-S oxidoreductase
MPAAPPKTDLAERLRAAVSGEVLDDSLSLGVYATDASMYQMQPLAVVCPSDRADVLAAMAVCAEAGVPMLPRATATSLTGQTVNHAVVIDISRHLDRVIAINADERWARVEPGVIRDRLNAQLREHGLQFAPDPATANRASVGGMIANNAAGMRSVRYGMTIDHLLEVELALADGEVLTLGPTDAENYAEIAATATAAGRIYSGFDTLISRHRDNIRERYPKVRRRSGGYALDAFVGDKPWNMARIVAASEGTLGMVLSAKLKLVPLPAESGLILAHFADMGDCLRTVAAIVDCGPSAVELIDGLIIRQARENLLTRDAAAIVEGDAAAVLVIEAQADTAAEVHRVLDQITVVLAEVGSCYARPQLLEPAAIASVWEMRASALGLMTTVKGDRKPVPYIEDAAVPLAVLPDYIEDVLAVCKRHDQPVSLFAHASVGLLHIRPLHDLHRAEEIAGMKQIQDDVFELVCKYGGSWSGEHGDGIVRGGYNRRFFGDALYAAFAELKALFDPHGLMNPGKIIETPPVDSNLRFGASYVFATPATAFSYRREGGIREAIEQCTGVGACRKLAAGTMCPSYMATRDEEHSTRGRANALRLAMSGQLGDDGLAHPRVFEALDLCLSCKGCRRECPNGVDMAKLKAELLHYRHRSQGCSWRDRLFAGSAASAGLASGALAPLANAVLGLAPTRALLARLGIDRRRPLPSYARQRFSNWFAAHTPATGEAGRVVLCNDTYSEHHLPEIGRDAVAVLTALGYQVEVVDVGDCQRAAMSKGFLDRARRGGDALLRRLQPYAEARVPLLCCEPSCTSALLDDLPDLVQDQALGDRVAAQTQFIDTFIADAVLNAGATLTWRQAVPQTLLVHGHCHQKALGTMARTIALLRQIPGATVTDSGAGCCGMAGAFGYESEHYELSVQVAEDRLLPALAQLPADATVVANGFSCRHQISDLTGRRPLHTVEVLARNLQ